MIRPANIDDVPKLEELYKAFLTEVWVDRTIVSDSIPKTIASWLFSKVDLLVATVEDEVVGFFLGYVDDNNGTLSPLYRAEVLYVLPKYRLTKLSYEMFRLPITIAKPHGLSIVSSASVTTPASKIYEKLGAKLLFKEMILQ